MPQEKSKQTIDNKQEPYHNYENASEGNAETATFNYPGLEGKYTILEKVGRGAQGTVFKAETPSGEIVAIKVFDFREAESWKDVDLLKREVDTLKKLDISGIPKFIEFIEKEPYSYLVESYIDGTSLKDMIAEGFEPTFTQIVEIFTHAMNILKNLHGQLHPVIHRDIKPGNLIVNLKTEDIRVWIVDFGTVAAARQRTNASTFAGTAGYLAPEQLFGKATPASDIYAMGMTMVHLISGVAPCDMEMDGLTLKYDKYLPTTLPKTFKDLLAEMVAPNPNDRIKDAESVLRRLKTFAPVVNNHSEHNDAALPSAQISNTSKLDDVVQESDVKDALSKLENYHQYSLKEKEKIFRELCDCYECKEVSLDVIVEQIKIVMENTRSYSIDFPAECVATTVLRLITARRLHEDKLALLNRLDKYKQYNLNDKEKILWKCYNDLFYHIYEHLSFDVIIECMKDVLDSAQKRSLELSIESLIDATLNRIKKQAKLRQKKMPEELELYAAVDGFEGYTIEERKDIIIQLYQKTGMNCFDIVRFIKKEQYVEYKIFGGKHNKYDLIRNTKISIEYHDSQLFKDPNEKEKSVLDEIYEVLANYKKWNEEKERYEKEKERCEKDNSKTGSDKVDKSKDKYWDELPINEQIAICPNLKQSGLTEMQVLELYAAHLEVFDKYSLDERKEMIFKCWNNTREEFDLIIKVLTEILSLPEYSVKRSISDVVSRAESRLNQERGHRLTLKPVKSELDKWVQAFEGYSTADKKDILITLYQETGCNCEKIVEAIKRVQDVSLPVYKGVLISRAKVELMYGLAPSVIMGSNLRKSETSAIKSVDLEAKHDDIIALENRMETLGNPINYAPFWIIFLTLVVLSGAGFGLYYIFQNFGASWGGAASVFVVSLILHLILLLFEKESNVLLIFFIISSLVVLIAIFIWNWVLGIIALGIVFYVVPKILKFFLE